VNVPSANGQRRTVNVRSVLAYLCLFAIVALRIEPQLLRLPFMDRTTFNRGLAQLADGEWWQYARFLEGVREHTHDGDTVTVVVPALKWDDGYSYAYYRASYFLAGREVLPLVTDDDRRHPWNFSAVRYVAAWHMQRRAGVGRVVWEGEGGVLLQR